MRLFRIFFKCCGPREEKKEDTLNTEKNLKEPVDDILSEFRTTSAEQSPLREKLLIENKASSEKENEVNEIVLSDNKFTYYKDFSKIFPNEYEIVLFEDRLLREDEIDKIKYTKRDLIEFTDYLINQEGYELLYNKNGLVLYSLKSGTPFSKDFFLAKSTFTVSKEKLRQDLTIQEIGRILYEPEARLGWDKSLKVLKKLEEGEEAYVVRSWMHSPMFMVSERETVDKRLEFVYKDTFYCFSNSVPENYISLEKDVVRVKTFINTLLISEDEQNFYFVSLNQVDFKMPISQKLINVTLPGQVLSWYKTLVDALSKK